MAITAPVPAMAVDIAETDRKHYELMYALSWPSAWPPPSPREMSRRQRMTGIEIEPASRRTVTTEQFIADYEQKGYNSNLLAIPIAGGADIVAKLVPIAKVGEWGIFGPPNFTAEDQAYWLAALRAIQHHAEVRPKIAETGLQVTIGSAGELIQALNAPQNQRPVLEPLAGGQGVLTADQQWQLFDHPGFGKNLTAEISARSPRSMAVAAQMSGADPTRAIEWYREGVERDRTAKVKSINVLYVTANAPKSALNGLKPLARIGDYGLFGPADLPPAVARDFEDAVYRALNTSAFRERLTELGLSPALGDADALRELMASLPGDAGPARARVAATGAATTASGGSPAAATPAGAGKIIAEAGDPNTGGYVAVYDQPGPTPAPPPQKPEPMGRPIIWPPDGPVSQSRSSDPPGLNLKDDGRRIGTWKPLISPEARQTAREQLTAHQKRMAEKAEKNRQRAAERSQRLRELTARNNREAAAILKKVQDDRNKWLADRRAHRTAQINRPDAITVGDNVINKDGNAYVRFTNNTDILLDVVYHWEGIRNGEKISGRGTAMVGPRTTTDAVILELYGEKQWRVYRIFNVTWTGDPLGVIL